jgi:hypothetical protein
MPRPKKADRSAIKDVTITLKLSGPERERLGQLMEARAAELQKMTGQHIPVTIAAYLRWLMDRDAAERRLASLSGGEPVTPKAPPRRKPSRQGRAPR